MSQQFQATGIASTTPPFAITGGRFSVNVSAAAWNSGNVQLQKLGSDGVTFTLFTPVIGTESATVTTDLATVTTDAATAVTDTTTADTDVGTCETDFDTMCSTGATYNLVALLNGQTYNSTTKQLSGTPGASVTLTTAQQTGLIAFVNALGAALVTAKTATAAAKTAAATASTDFSTLKTDTQTLQSSLTGFDGGEFTANGFNVLDLVTGVYQFAVTSATGVDIDIETVPGS